MPKPVGLTTALTRLSAGDLVPALGILLAVWRSTRNGELGRLLCQFGASTKVSLPSWNFWMFEELPRSEARFYACLTLVGSMPSHDVAFGSLLELMAEQGPDPRVGALAVRLVFDDGARWTTRTVAARLVSQHLDGELLERFRALETESGGVHPKLRESLGTLCFTESTLLDAELVNDLAVALQGKGAALGQSFSDELLTAHAERKRKQEQRAAQRAQVPDLAWQRPSLTASPRMAEVHLLPGGRGEDAVASVPPRPRETLSALLAAWRANRSAETAAQLELLDVAERRALRKSAKAQLNATWVEAARARDSRATGWLAEALFSGLELEEASYFAFELDDHVFGQADDLERNPNDVQQRFGSLLQRFDALEALLPDPRAAAIFATFVCKPSIPGIGREALFERLLRVIVKAGDPRQLAVLDAVAKQEPWKRQSDRRYFAQALPKAIAELKAVCEQRKISATESSPQPPGHHPLGESGTPDRLVDAVLAAPDDDAPRLVLADWLMERGAPRGEFISLQLRAAQSKLTPSEATKMTALERKHRADWLGPLARTLTGVRWSRGFLDSASLRQNANAPDGVWNGAYTHPALETVTRLELGVGNARHYCGFLQGGRLLSLDEKWVPASVRRLLSRRRAK